MSYERPYVLRLQRQPILRGAVQDVQFGSLEHARSHCGVFFPFYNDVHRHSGLAMLTPADLHYGRVAERIAASGGTITLDAAGEGCAIVHNRTAWRLLRLDGGATFA